MPGSRTRGALLALVLLLLPALGHAEPRRLAIFDLANRTGDQALDWVGAALGVAFRDRLGALGEFDLVNPRLARRADGKKNEGADALEPLLRRARATGAEQALLGTYSQAGGRLRVEARFVDVASALTVSAASVTTLDSDTAGGFTRIGDAVVDAALDALAARSVPGSIEPLTIARGARPSLTPPESHLTALPWTVGRASSEALGRAVIALDDRRPGAAIPELERVTSAGGQPPGPWLLLGSARAQNGDCAGAITALERALQWSVRHGHTRGEILARYRLAGCLAENGDDTAALAELEETRRRATAAGSASLQTLALHAMGLIHARAGRNADALTAWRESAQLAEHVADAAHQAGVLPGIAAVLYYQGALAEARDVAGRAARLAETAEQLDEQVAALTVMGLAEAGLGRRAEALTHLIRSAELSESIGGTRDAGPSLEETWLHIGRIYLDDRKPLEAQVAFERAQRRAAQVRSGPEETEALRLLALAHVQQNHLAEGVAAFQRGIQLAEQRGDELSTAIILYELAQTQAASGREADALVNIERALEIATRIGLPERDEIRQTREQIRERIQGRKG